MHISRHVITVTNTTATTESTGTSWVGANGTIYAVRSPYVDTMPTTNTLTVYAGSTDRVVLSGVTFSNDTIMYYPRVAVVNSTIASTSWGTSTDMDMIACAHCITSTEKLSAISVGTASSNATRDVEIFMEGE